MHLETRGSGPDIVCLHGAPQGPNDLERLAASLGTEGRVTLVHLPGYGSSPPRVPYDLDQVARDLASDLVAAGIDSPVLIGISGGAYRCLQLALEDGPLCPRGLFLIGPYANLEPDTREAMRGFGAALAAGADLVDVGVARFFSEPWVRSNATRARSIVSEMLSSVDRTGAQAEFDAVADSADLRPRVGEIRVPTFLRVGECDQATPTRCAYELEARLPDVELEVVPGRGHLLHHEDFEGTLAAIRRFIETRCV